MTTTTTNTKANTKVITYPNGITKAIYSPKPSTKAKTDAKEVTKVVTTMDVIASNIALQEKLSAFNNAALLDSISGFNKAKKELTKVVNNFNKAQKECAANLAKKAEKWEEVVKQGLDTYEVCKVKYYKSLNSYAFTVETARLKFSDYVPTVKQLNNISYSLYADLLYKAGKKIDMEVTSTDFKKWYKENYKALKKKNTLTLSNNALMKNYDSFFNGFAGIHLKKADFTLLTNFLLKGFNAKKIGLIDHLGDSALRVQIERLVLARILNVPFKIEIPGKKSAFIMEEKN